MDILQEVKVSNQYGFFQHVFSTSEESKAEILNVIQYSLMAIIPIVILNKSIQQFIPEADPEKSSLELLAEILIQVVVMFVGIILIHRIITYVPTYSGYKYDGFNLITVVLAFLVIVLSLQTKLGIKVNILFDRASELWNGPGEEKKRANMKKANRNPALPNHVESQSDYDGGAIGVFPPPPAIASTNRSSGQAHDYMIKVSSQGGNGPADYDGGFGPAPANSVLGGAFF